ncbi:uncharacterized protein Fot_30329 [Forsythia ovata]|uniref:PB1-like domain-containing protein n=1 Tax=Forsythia ovata TaxID=205694 RepID=A0ABD1TUE7_9LAMI
MKESTITRSPRGSTPQKPKIKLYYSPNKRNSFSEGKKSPYFTVKIHHGCIMFTKPNNLVYEHGDVDYMDYVYSSNLNREPLDKLVEGVGLDVPMGFLYRKQKFSLLEGLVRIRSNVDIDMLLKDRNGANEVEIYLMPHSRTYELE